MSAQDRKAATNTDRWVAAQAGDPLDLFRQIKFAPVGFDPIGGSALNLAAQINQTWTCTVAQAAARLLLELHPEAAGHRLAPSAHASIALEIMSRIDGLVGTETFAAVDPKNNRNLEGDLKILSSRSERHR